MSDRALGMGGTRLLIVTLAAALAVVVAPTPAHSQCRLCEKPTTTIDAGPGGSDVQLEIETTLNFDRLILAGSGQGEAVIRPDGSTMGTGAIGNVGPRAAVATVVVHGEPNRTLRIEVPRRIDLYSLGGGRLTFDQVVTDAGSLPRLDGAGKLTFHIGGTLRFKGSEDGDFRGDLPITVEYQ